MKKILYYLPLFVLVFLLSSCAANGRIDGTQNMQQIVNIYTARHYDTDDQIFINFENRTGIKVNIVKGTSDQLLERIRTEGSSTEADLYITADLAGLHRAKASGLLSPVASEVLDMNVPENLKDPDDHWFGFTKRARVIVHSKDRVKPGEILTYMDLADPEWKGKVLVRGSDSAYNQTLLASFIHLMGRDSAKEWASGITSNFARRPRGGDRDQVLAIAAGEGDVAIINTYYLGLMLTSSDLETRNAAKTVSVVFPDQGLSGTHINISGVAVLEHAKNRMNAVKLIEYLVSEEAQEVLASLNHEYPVLSSVDVSDILASFGPFIEQQLELSDIGGLTETALMIFHEVGWE